jgi:hypothetical protein
MILELNLRNRSQAKSVDSGITTVLPRGDLILQLPAATILSRRRRKITKPPFQGHPPYQSARQLWVHPYQSERQQTITIYTSPAPHIAWGSLSLFVCTADPPSPSDQGSRDPHTPSPLLSIVSSDAASIWPFGDNSGSQTKVRIKQVNMSVHETTQLWRKLHPKVQLFQREGGGMLYWPACWVAYERKSWRACS